MEIQLIKKAFQGDIGSLIKLSPVTGTTLVVTFFDLLLETGDHILLEDGTSKLLMEASY